MTIILILALPICAVVGFIIGSFFSRDINKYAVKGGLVGLVSLIPLANAKKASLPNTFINFDIGIFQFRNENAFLVMGDTGVLIYFLISFPVIIIAGLAANAYCKKNP